MTEGRQMKHCVATYVSSCARGHCSIWTMEVESMDGVTRAVTIEVRNSARMICQVRGKANPTDRKRTADHSAMGGSRRAADCELLVNAQTTYDQKSNLSRFVVVRVAFGSASTTKGSELSSSLCLTSTEVVGIVLC